MIVDRVEGKQVVIERDDGGHEDVPLAQIQGRVRDGAVLREHAGGGFEVDEEETLRRAKQAASRLRELLSKGFSKKK